MHKFITDASREDGELKTVAIVSLNFDPCQIKYGDKVMDLNLEKGEVKEISW